MSSANRLREPMTRQTEAFIIYNQSSALSADDYLIDADYPIETYL
jgi:hypothetical protein